MVALSFYEWNMLLKLKVPFLLFRVKSLSHAFDLKFPIPYVGISARGFHVHERILQVLLCLWLLWVINPQKVTTLKGDCWDLGLINKVHFRHGGGSFLVPFVYVLPWYWIGYVSASTVCLFKLIANHLFFKQGNHKTLAWILLKMINLPNL